MASYFDAQPLSSKGSLPKASVQDEELETTFGKQSLLSPQITSILDDLGDEGSSSSSEHAESSSHSEEDNRGRKTNRQDESSGKPNTSPFPAAGKKATPLNPHSRPGLGGGKHPHLARFHSLRSMLFSSHIENSMAHCREQQQKEEAEAKWKADHSKRQGLNRPKTPPGQGESSAKEGFRQKMHSTLRRMTSKEPPSQMASVAEDDNESTASDTEINAGNFEGSKKWDEKLVSDDESIQHSDVDDLVRWVSRRDPPSDGEATKRRSRAATANEVNDNRHGSLGHEHIDELVRHATRKGPVSTEAVENLPQDYSEESTASDSESDGQDRERRHSEDEDADELVRWIIRRDPGNAGPVNAIKESKSTESNDTDHKELMRWVTKQDDTSGESDMEAIVNKHTRASVADSGGRRSSRGHESLRHDDVDELVRWVTNKDPSAKAKDSTHNLNPGKETEKTDLNDDDVDELVRWVSKKHDSPQAELAEEQRDEEILKWKEEEDEKKKVNLGMKAQPENQSLGHEDVDELVQWVSRKH